MFRICHSDRSGLVAVMLDVSAPYVMALGILETDYRHQCNRLQTGKTLDLAHRWITQPGQRKKIPRKGSWHAGVIAGWSGPRTIHRLGRDKSRACVSATACNQENS
jgi:hypothetical protein